MIIANLKKRMFCAALTGTMLVTPLASIQTMAAESTDAPEVTEETAENVQLADTSAKTEDKQDLSASVDMTNVKLNSDTATIVLPSNEKGVYYAASGYTSTSLKFSGSTHTFNKTKDKSHISTSNSNKSVPVNYDIVNNKLILQSSKVGSTTFKIKLYGKLFQVKLNVVRVKPDRKHAKTYGVGTSKNYKLLAQKKEGGAYSKVTSGITWKTDNAKVATVSKEGKMTAVYPGNALITAKYGKVTWHWIVSVTKTKKMAAINKGLSLKKGKYSQPLRMSKGYYDCSSLVWRSYAPQGFNFGQSSYAPTAAEEAKYLVNHKGQISGGLSSTNIKNLKLRAGDLLFRTGASNGRFKGIYHVEMIRGYAISKVYGAGKVSYTVRYVNRTNGYAEGENNTIVCRPYFN